MNVEILELIEWAKKAGGIAVVIDVFRAFSLECYLFGRGAERIYAVGGMDEAFALKREHPEYILIGERHGKMVEGCDFGNSPSQTEGADFKGKTVIHSTSAGTQGIVNASGADRIITGSLVNAKAVAQYIRSLGPERVCLIAMGNSGVRTAKEDVLCVQYIRCLLTGQAITDDEGNEYGPEDIGKLSQELRHDGGAHFFDPQRQEIYPEKDFFMCTQCNAFDFVIEAGRDEAGRLITFPRRGLPPVVE